MASKREGIALLSMYNDEEEEEEEEEAGGEQQAEDMMEEDHADQKYATAAAVSYSEPSMEKYPLPRPSPAPLPEEDLDSRIPTSPASPTSPLPSSLQASAPPPSTSLPSSPALPPPSSSFPDSLGLQRSRIGALAIVDYAHDETAMSPDAEDGEIVGAGRVLLAAELQETDGVHEEKTTPSGLQTSTPNPRPSPYEPYEQPEMSKLETNRAMDITGHEAPQAEANVEVSVETQEDVDPLKKFLPPPPTVKCPQELQDKINKFLALKRSGKSFNVELRNMKAYRNPDFLQHAVRYQEINQTGTCFSKDVFDPQGYDQGDYYDEIEADMKHEIERREQERKRSPKVEFISGGTQPLLVPPVSKINLVPVTGVSAVAATGQQSISGDASTRDSRQSKKSKWDKVDSDPRNLLQTGGHDSVSTAGAHAALLSAANAGAGYTAFAQQKRKEAEEKKVKR